MPSTPTHSIERAARPFLPKLLQIAAEAGRFPGDYFLLLGKYDPKSSAIVPRSAAADIVELGKTEARRRKYERLLASPCERNELLVLLCAGDHVEGHWMKVPALLPQPRAPQTKRLGGPARSDGLPDEVAAYLRVHIGGIVATLRQKKERLGDWYALLRVPNEVPVILRRSFARKTLTPLGVDVDDVLREMEASADDEVFCIYPDADGGGFRWHRVTTSFAVVKDETFEEFASRLLEECTASLRHVKQNPSDYMAYVKWSAPAGEGADEAESGGTGKSVQPMVFPRSTIGSELREMCGDRKYEQIVAHLADPFDGLMLFIDDAGKEDIKFAANDEGFVREVNGMAAEAVRRWGLE